MQITVMATYHTPHVQLHNLTTPHVICNILIPILKKSTHMQLIRWL